jgi:hypothetical protein
VVVVVVVVVVIHFNSLLIYVLTEHFKDQLQNQNSYMKIRKYLQITIDNNYYYYYYCHNHLSCLQLVDTQYSYYTECGASV